MIAKDNLTLQHQGQVIRNVKLHKCHLHSSILFCYYYYYYIAEGFKKIEKGNTMGMINQSVQSGASKLSCNKMALKRCTSTEHL